MSSENRIFLKIILRLAPAIILQELLSTFVNLLDTVMIGKSMGSNEIAAIGLGNQLFFLSVVMTYGVTSGAAIYIGQYWGKKDHESIHKTMGIGFTIAGLVSVVFFTLAVVFPHVVMGIYSRDPVVIKIGVDYLRIVGFCYPLLSIIMVKNAALRAVGQTRLPMFTTFTALIMNLTFNYLFLFVLKLEAPGAAAATLIARLTEVIAQHILIKAMKIPIQAGLKQYFSYTKEYLRKYLKVTVFVLLNEMTWSIGVSMYQIAYGLCGTSAQAAVQISSTITQLFQVLGMAIGSACAIMLSNELGRGERELAVKYSRKCLALSFLISSLTAVILYFAAPFVIAFYGDVGQEVSHMARNILNLFGVILVVRTLNFTTICGVLRSGGDTVFCFVIDCAAVWFIGIPLGFMGAAVWNLPIHLVFFLTNFEEFIKLFFAMRRVLSNKWANTLV